MKGCSIRKGTNDARTRFRWMWIEPLASTVAVSPRRDTTLPRMRTVWFVKFSKYVALTRGVASEDILWKMSDMDDEEYVWI